MPSPASLWRISDFAGLSGIGAEFAGARWHTRAEGKRIVYLAEHPAVAFVETLVNLRGNPHRYPETFQLLKISANDTVSSSDLARDQIALIDPRDHATTQRIGDAWLAERSSALLRIPSIPSPESWNYLLNPLHPEAVNLTIEWARKLTYDRRLFRLDP